MRKNPDQKKLSKQQMIVERAFSWPRSALDLSPVNRVFSAVKLIILLAGLGVTVAFGIAMLILVFSTILEGLIS